MASQHRERQCQPCVSKLGELSTTWTVEQPMLTYFTSNATLFFRFPVRVRTEDFALIFSRYTHSTLEPLRIRGQHHIFNRHFTMDHQDTTTLPTTPARCLTPCHEKGSLSPPPLKRRRMSPTHQDDPEQNNANITTMKQLPLSVFLPVDLDHCGIPIGASLKPRNPSWERATVELLAQPPLRMQRRRSSCADFSLISVTSLASLV